MRCAAILLFATAITAAGQCNYSLSPPEIQVGPLDFTNTIQMYASPNCGWTAQSLNPDWIQIIFGGSGSGNGSFAIRVRENISPEPRSGSIRAGNATLSIVQFGASCNYSITPTTTSVGSGSGIGTFFINSRCSWTARSDVSWIRLSGPGSSGITNTIGNGAVVYEYDQNTTAGSRFGTITIAPGVVFRLNQDGTVCDVTLPGATLFLGPTGGSDFIQVQSQGCQWAARPDVSWIRFEDAYSAVYATGAGAGGRIKIVVGANPGINQRAGTVTVGNKVFTVVQGGGACNYSVTPGFVNLPVNGGTATFRINAPDGCVWNAVPNSPWVSVLPGAGTGPQTVAVSADFNTSGLERSAVITIQGTTFGVVQSADPAPTIYAVVNAASLEPVTVSPGQIVLIRGSRLGPATWVDAVADFGTFLFPKEVAGSEVFFDGIPAPILYTQEGVIRAVVPYAIADRQRTEVRVYYQGRRSDGFTVPVAPASPAIFTLDESGRGSALARTENYEFSDVSNPGRLGEEMILYATGEGVTLPAGIDGRVIGETVTRPQAPVRVYFRDRPMETTYIGGAPGQVSGLLQINVRLPFDLTPGDAIPVTIYVGDMPSQSGVTVSVR
jgi:uncharacterized protein (TIGR03437 family)